MVTADVLQGSVLRPRLWNAMYIGTLGLQVSNKLRLIGFADDLALMVVAKHSEDV